MSIKIVGIEKSHYPIYAENAPHGCGVKGKREFACKFSYEPENPWMDFLFELFRESKYLAAVRPQNFAQFFKVNLKHF